MKKLFTFVFITVLLIGGILWYVFNRNTSTILNNNANIVIPLGKLILTDGSMIDIPLFIFNNEAQTKIRSDIFRDIAGNEQSNYIISYLPYNKENSQIEFNILLNTLPLSKSRLEAEEELRTKLNLTNQQLCKLEVYVSVFGWVDEKYSGQNLGLSFCSNSITLP